MKRNNILILTILLITLYFTGCSGNTSKGRAHDEVLSGSTTLQVNSLNPANNTVSSDAANKESVSRPSQEQAEPKDLTAGIVVNQDTDKSGPNPSNQDKTLNTTENAAENIIENATEDAALSSDSTDAAKLFTDNFISDNKAYIGMGKEDNNWSGQGQFVTCGDKGIMSLVTSPTSQAGLYNRTLSNQYYKGSKNYMAEVEVMASDMIQEPGPNQGYINTSGYAGFFIGFSQNPQLHYIHVYDCGYGDYGSKEDMYKLTMNKWYKMKIIRKNDKVELYLNDSLKGTWNLTDAGEDLDSFGICTGSPGNYFRSFRFTRED